MNYQEVLEMSKGHMGEWCRSCPVCNGKACSNHIPGPGAKGTGTAAVRNYEDWQKVFVNVDTIASGNEVDTSFTIFGRTFRYPVFAGPVGAVDMHYSDELNDTSYNDILVRGAKEARGGRLPFAECKSARASNACVLHEAAGEAERAVSREAAGTPRVEERGA